MSKSKRKAMITSKTNKIIKLVKSLEKKKYQDKYGLYVLEGIKFVKDAVINKNHIIKYIITTEEYTEDYDDALEVDNEIFKYISSTKTPQGVLAVLETKYCDINDINKNDNILYLDTVQDPENVGGLIRSSVCTDFDAVILNSSASPFLSKAVRASAGSIINTKIILDEDYKILKTLKEKGFDIIASTLNGKEDITLNKKNNVLIVGNEGNGISDECLKYATKDVKIPMSGKCESLNANVSGSILMYKIYGFL